MTTSNDIKKARLEQSIQGSTDGKLLCDVDGDIIGLLSGNITGNAGTVTNGVYTTGNQTIGGTKNFSSTITGNITGNAATVTNGVYLSGSSIINGIKNFTSHPQVAGKYIHSRSAFFSDAVNQAYSKTSGSGTFYFGLVIGGYLPHSSNSKIIAFYRLAYDIQQKGAGNIYGNAKLIVNNCQNNGVAISRLSGDPAAIYNIGYYGAPPHKRYHVLSVAGPAAKASDGKYYVNCSFNYTASGSPYELVLTNRYHSVTYLELF
jgi:hypothetical protein